MRQSYEVVAALAAAASLACRPAPGLGTLHYVQAGVRHAVDLATCRERTLHSLKPVPRELRSPDGTRIAYVYAGPAPKQTIVVRNVRTRRQWNVLRGPEAIELLGWSPDGRWLLYAIDPMSSQSIAADGLRLRAVGVVTGGVVPIAPTLMYDDYRAWCSGALFLSAGGNRLATADKRLLVTRPGSWRTETLGNRRRAWGSLVCAPGGHSVVVQSQRATDPNDMTLDRSHWALWRVGLDGSRRRLTSPPPGWSDDSPRFAGRTLFFVRSRRGFGRIYALRGGRLLGPFATLRTDTAYYGHRAWPYGVRP
jgi:WD40-like Beta Propeller Repeat